MIAIDMEMPKKSRVKTKIKFPRIDVTKIPEKYQYTFSELLKEEHSPCQLCEVHCKKTKGICTLYLKKGVTIEELEFARVREM